MHSNLNCISFVKLISNLIILYVFTFKSIAANDVKNCTIGVLDDCPPNEVCIQYHTTGPEGRCGCGPPGGHNCRDAPAVKPLPIYSFDDNTNQSSALISSTFVAIISVMVIISVYYFGVRKGQIRDLWHRTFTARQFEHQLMDRSPQLDDNNDSEAIA